MSASRPAELAPVLEAAGPRAAALLEALEDRLVEAVAERGEVLGEQASSTIEAGGKRLRPLLVFVAAGDGGEAEQLLRAGAAVELIHSASLVHDDVLDRSALRRGRPTVVAAAGRVVATATGDLLFSRAFAQLARNGSAEQVRALSDAASALARGELLQREDAYDLAVSQERYLERCELKTASLFEAAARLGALASNGPADALGAFGRDIGLAFQILDDVLDVFGPPERTGKPRGADLLDGTVTLPLILARERDPQLVRTQIEGLDPPQAENLCDAIAATGALELARARAMALVEQARSSLPSLPGDQRQALEAIAQGVVDRYA